MLKSADKLFESMKPGSIMRRVELARLSKAVDRDLKSLESKKAIKKVGPGLYYKPKRSRYGELPPKDEDMVKAFLKGDRFLMISPTDYNLLGLGLTQVYNKTVVYNRKRYETVSLGGREFAFIRPLDFPAKVTKEYLLVDLVNNLGQLAEDQEQVRNKLKEMLDTFDRAKLQRALKRYGKNKTKQYFEEILKNVYTRTS